VADIFYTLTGENKFRESKNILLISEDRMEAPPSFIFRNVNSSGGDKNGRVNLESRPSAGGFLENPQMGGFGHRTSVDTNPAQDLMRGNWMETSLSQKFFGPENTKVIQAEIKKEVYTRSGNKRWIIDDQSADELQIVMRSIYLQYAKNQENNIPGQIKDLNDLIIEWCVPRILSEIGMYQYYLNDISKMPVPMAHPASQSSAGSKSLPFRKFM
jgi:hypothetical protein